MCLNLEIDSEIFRNSVLNKRDVKAIGKCYLVCSTLGREVGNHRQPRPEIRFFHFPLPVSNVSVLHQKLRHAERYAIPPTAASWVVVQIMVELVPHSGIRTAKNALKRSLHIERGLLRAPACTYPGWRCMRNRRRTFLKTGLSALLP